MLAETTTNRPPIEEITLYWRTHDAHGRLPKRQQSWWIRLIDEDGGVTHEPYGSNSDMLYCTLAECVVGIAEELDMTIDVEHVYRGGAGLSASWSKSAYEEFIDAC